MGATHFLMRSLRNVSTEMALNVLVCNLKRVMALVGARAAMITPCAGAVRTKLPTAESLRAASVTKQIPAILPRNGSKKNPVDAAPHCQRFSHSPGLADFLQRVVGVDAECAARPSRSAEARRAI